MKYKSCTLLFLLFSASGITAQNHLPNDTIQQRYFTELKKTGNDFIRSFRPYYVEVYSLPEKGFTDKMDSARANFLSVLQGYKSKLDKTFIDQQAVEINYYFDKLLVEYPDTHTIYTGEKVPYTSAIVKRLDKNLPDFNNPAPLGNTDFTDYARSFFAFQVRHELGKPLYKNLDNRFLAVTWKLIPRWISNKQCLEFWQYDYLYHHIDNLGIKHIDTFYNDFKAGCSDTAQLRKITSLYNDDYTGRQGHLIKTYKTVGPFGLDIHIFLPDSISKGYKRPAIVFFHGGSWSEGKPDWFFDACKSYAQKGWVACAVEYRVYSRQGTLPFEAVKDARSAIRWLRQHAADYQIDTGRIVASGNSAGGHLVLTSALADQWNESTDDKRYSPVPNVLLVNSGVFDLTDRNTAWIRSHLKNKELVKQISPNYLVHKGMPPTLIIHSTNDGNVPYATAKTFEAVMLGAGNPVEFHTMAGAGHFIWYDPKYAEEVGKMRQAFLQKLGY